MGSWDHKMFHHVCLKQRINGAFSMGFPSIPMIFRLSPTHTATIGDPTCIEGLVLQPIELQWPTLQSDGGLWFEELLPANFGRKKTWNSSMAMTQEPIDWRYRFHIFLAYVSGLNFREYPHISHHQPVNGKFRILKWRYVNVPYFWPYELWGYSLKFRPEK